MDIDEELEADEDWEADADYDTIESTQQGGGRAGSHPLPLYEVPEVAVREPVRAALIEVSAASVSW